MHSSEGNLDVARRVPRVAHRARVQEPLGLDSVCVHVAIDVSIYYRYMKIYMDMNGI